MHIIFESGNPERAQMRVAVMRRVRFALRDLGWLAPRVKVHMSDVQGPCAGIDKRCRVELSTPEDGSVVVTSTTRDWLSALQSALARASRSLLHNLKPAGQQKRRTVSPRTTAD